MMQEEGLMGRGGLVAVMSRLLGELQEWPETDGTTALASSPLHHQFLRLLLLLCLLFRLVLGT